METTFQEISQRVKRLLSSVPANVSIVAAAKKRTAAEVQAAIQAGIRHVGHNYVQEGKQMLASLPAQEREAVTYHLIGHLQRNKALQAVQTFDVIQTIDSAALAIELEHHCLSLNKILPVLIEINSAREENKNGLLLEEAYLLAQTIQDLPHLRFEGLMTIGAWVEQPEKMRPYFRETRLLFEDLKKISTYAHSLRYLSMGMSDSYQIAIEEGANLIRLGTLIFGERAL